MLRVDCPKCAMRIECLDSMVGMVVVCPKCLVQLPIPAALVLTAPAASAAPDGRQSKPVAGVAATSRSDGPMLPSPGSISLPDPLPLGAQQFGKPLAEFRANRAGSRVVVGAIGLVLGMALFAGLIAIKDVSYVIAPQTWPGDQTALALLAGGSVLSVAGVGLIVLGLSRLRRRVILFERGFLYFRPFRRPFLCRWDALEILQESEPRLLCTVRTNDGTVVFTDKIASVDSLCERLKQVVSDCLVPRVLADVRAGRSVRFSPFQVSAKGLLYQNELLPWDTIERLETGESELIVTRRQGGEIRVPLGAWRTGRRW